jgi:hypothetical protein
MTSTLCTTEAAGVIIWEVVGVIIWVIIWVIVWIIVWVIVWVIAWVLTDLIMGPTMHLIRWDLAAVLDVSWI